MRLGSYLNSSVRRAAGAFTLTLALAAPGAAIAQPGGGGGGGQPPGAPAASPEMQGKMEEMRQKRQELQQIQERLQEIQQKAIEANPDLAKQRDEYQSLVQDKMEDTGYDASAGQKKVEGLASDLQDEGTSREEKQQAMQKLRQEQQAAQQAREEAMQDEEVASARSDLRDDVMEAMKEQDPEVEQLIAEFERKRKEFAKLRQEMREQAGGGGSPMAPGGG